MLTKLILGRVFFPGLTPSSGAYQSLPTYLKVLKVAMIQKVATVFKTMAYILSPLEF